jgi:hypothetical protein
MSNQQLPPPFIADPPIYNDLFNRNGSISNSWSNWFDSITRVTGRVIVHDYLIVGGVRTQEFPTLQAISMTTTERDSLDNARDGVIIYNTTTGRMNFREGGAWVTFVPIAA